MRRGPLIALVLAALAFFGLFFFVLSGATRSGPHLRDAGPGGYRALGAYLEARGFPLEAHLAPLDQLAPRRGDVLIIAGPHVRPIRVEELDALEAFLQSGGRVVLLHSGLSPFESVAEQMLLLHLELGTSQAEEREFFELDSWEGLKRSLNVSRWREARSRSLLLERAESAPEWVPKGALAVPPRAWSVGRPGRARTLYRDPDGAPALFVQPRGRGELVVVNNAGLFANAWLGERSNLAFLEALLVELRGPRGRVVFDEWRHGFAEREAALEQAGPATEALAAHLLLCYLLAAWGLSRRFGPLFAPRERAGTSLRRELDALAGLHRASGHASAAGRTMLEAAERLAPREARAERLGREFTGNEKNLVDLARELGALQREGRLGPRPPLRRPDAAGEGPPWESKDEGARRRAAAGGRVRPLDDEEPSR